MRGAGRKAPIEIRVWNRLHLRRRNLHLSVRLLYGVPGEAMSNIHANFIQHSNSISTINCGHTHQIVCEIRQFPRAIAKTFASRARFIFSRRLVRRNSDSRRRVRGVGDLPWYSIVFGRSNARRATS